jgi:hypothetical protein
VLAFVAFVVACAAGSAWFVTPPLIWTARQLTEHTVRVDLFGELAAIGGATLIMVRLIDVRPWSDLGFSRPAARVGAWVTGLCVGGGANLFACTVLLVAGLARFDAVSADSAWAAAAFRVTIVLLPAALAEELLCRGYLLTVIRDSVGTTGAVIITSVIFGLLHLKNPGASALSVGLVILAGLWLATVRIALDSMYAAWMAHFAWNWMMAVPFHAAVSAQQFESPAYRMVMLEPAWISGGTWGPEGGVIAGLGMLGALGYFYARRSREES